MSTTAVERKQRTNGVESRRRILDAAVEIAGERGYEGTSIKAVSERSGLPASSIYWHFADKDDLIAAVIERSFDTWLQAVELPATGTPRERVRARSACVAQALVEAPDFLRLGLMLALERRPVEARGRSVFLQVRKVASERVAAMVADLLPDLGDDDVRLLTTYAVAAADGLFVAHEVDGDVDLGRLFELHAELVLDAAIRISERGRR